MEGLPLEQHTMYDRKGMEKARTEEGRTWKKLEGSKKVVILLLRREKITNNIIFGKLNQIYKNILHMNVDAI